MWFIQDPAPPYSGILGRDTFVIGSSPGATGAFRTDSSRRVFTISGCVTTTRRGVRGGRHHLTFVIQSSALTSLVLREERGVKIEWEKWKGTVTTIDRRVSRFSVAVVEGSRVFILEEKESRFTVYDFSPGAGKDQRSPQYTLHHIALTTIVPMLSFQRSWKVSGDNFVLLTVSDLNFVHTCLIFGSTSEFPGSGDSGALHRHYLVHLRP